MVFRFGGAMRYIIGIILFPISLADLLWELCRLGWIILTGRELESAQDSAGPGWFGS